MVSAATVREIAACPACRSELEWRAEEVECRSCPHIYRMLGGVPILLVAGDDPPRDDAWYPGLLRSLPRSLREFAERHRQRLQPPLCYRSPSSAGVVTRFLESLPPTALVANVGAGTTSLGPNVFNIDVEPFPGTHIVGVAERLPLRTHSVDGAVVQAVLEHVARADLALQELQRVIRPGGSLIVEIPFIQGYHPSPADYRWLTEQGLRAELGVAGFEVRASGVAVGPASATTWVLAEFLALLAWGRSENAYRVLRAATYWAAAPLKYADRWLDRHPMAFVIASAVWAIAQAPSSEHAG